MTTIIEQMQIELDALSNAINSVNLVQIHILDKVISSLTDEQLNQLKEYCFTQCDGTEMSVVKVDRKEKSFICVPSYEITDTIDEVNPELYVRLGYNTEDIDSLQAKSFIQYVMFNIIKNK